MKARVLVALSGGVDSSTAAALLVQRGFQVEGATMQLWPRDDHLSSDAVGSGMPAFALRAQAVCQLLGIPFHLVHLEHPFQSQVIDHLCDSYAAGRTPNPCVRCNKAIKFGALLDLALQMGMAYLATGHYARVRRSNSRYELLRGADVNKDQSYMLHLLNQRELAHVLFPVGGYTKAEIRELAQRMNLPTAEQPESQDWCYLQGEDYRDLVARTQRFAPSTGPIVDTDGRTLGQHRGIPFYTVGQRQGLGLSSEHALYVIEIDPQSKAIIVGHRDKLARRSLEAEDVNFVSGSAPPGPIAINAKIRYRTPEAKALLYPLRGRAARVVFEEPQRAIAPGQSVVFYRDDVVLGGGTIRSSLDMED